MDKIPENFHAIDLHKENKLYQFNIGDYIKSEKDPKRIWKVSMINKTTGNITAESRRIPEYEYPLDNITIKPQKQDKWELMPKEEVKKFLASLEEQQKI